MRLTSNPDPILVTTALCRQELHDLEHAAAPAAPVEPGRIVHRLPNLELVVAQIVTEGFLPAQYMKIPSSTATYCEPRQAAFAMF
jgi:hypothetical protein